METEQSRSEDDSTQEESVEEFQQEIESDPSTASSDEAGDTDLDRLRGG
jgi:hypothetical protein